MPKILAGDREFFKGVNQVKYEGTEPGYPVVFRRYDENNVVAGKSLKDHVYFALAYRHSFSRTGFTPLPLPNPSQIRSCSGSNPWNT